MAPSDEKFVLHLYVNGRSGRSRQAIDRLSQILDEHAPGQYQLSVIDIREDPEALERDQVLATPTLVKKFPEPYTRLVGDFADKIALLTGIDLVATT